MKNTNDFLIQRLLSIALIVLFVTGDVVAAAATSVETRELLEQASYWQFNGRDDLAESIWHKVLRVDDQQLDALFGLGVQQAQRGADESATDYLRRISSVDRNHSYVSRLSRAIEVGFIDPERLSQARNLAKAGKTQEAVVTYQSLWGDLAPEGALALEYYQTLGGVPGGWAPAREQLERLVSENPDNPHYSFALGKHLTYRKATRRRGINILAALAGTPNIDEVVTRSWRQALSWLQLKPGDERLYQRFLDRYPNDKTIRRKFRNFQAYKAIDAGELATAARHLQDALRDDPDDADALGGLGLVRLKQKQFHQAAALLKQASSVSAAAAKAWKDALAEAKFWALFNDANAAREANQFSQAEDLLRQAIAVGPKEFQSRVILADVLAQQGRLSEAEVLYRQVLAETPENDDAKLGLANVLAAQGRVDVAMSLVETLPSDDVRTRVTMARLLLRKGSSDRALALVDEVLKEDPTNMLALETKASAYAEHGDVAQALLVLDNVPTSQRSEGLASLQKRLWIRYQIERASKMIELGLPGEARRVVDNVNEEVADDLDHLSQLADAWARVGERGRAIELVRGAMARSQPPSAGLRLQLAGLLLQEGRYAELQEQLNAISSLAELSARERGAYQDMKAGFIITQADLARESGDLAGAYEWLAPAIGEHSEVASLNLALARLHATAGDYERAEDLYRAVIGSDPQLLDAWVGNIDTLVKDEDYKSAEKQLNEALQYHPNDPQLLILGGRIAKAQSAEKQALRYFKIAQAHPENLATIEVNHNGLRTVRKDEALSLGERPKLFVIDEQGQAQPIESEIKQLTAPPAPRVESVSPRSEASQARARMVALQPEIDALLPHSQSENAIGGASIRIRDGEAGLDELSEYSLPMEFGLSLGDRTLAYTRIMPVLLDSGYFPTQNAATRFGTNALSAGVISTSESQDEAGAAASLGIRSGTFNLDVGTSPVGFEVENVVGGLAWRPNIGKYGAVGFQFSQREVIDSLLSYAGTVDARTGEVWGGVIRSGGLFELAFDNGQFGVYGNVSYRELTGENVADNEVTGAATGFYWPVPYGENNAMSFGANFTYFEYEKNLRFFTFGHGGYFSPQSYVGVSASLDWSGRVGSLSYRLGGSVGLQSYREDAAPYFPTDPILQSRLEQFAVADPEIETEFAGKSESGLIHHVRAELEYLVAPQVSVGGFLLVSQAHDFEELNFVVYARHWLRPRKPPVSFPPEPLRPRR